MAELLPAFVILLVIVAVFGLMAWGWRGRRRRQAHVPAPEAVPADLGEPAAHVEALHVATTLADEPLERVAVHGLGFRASTRLSVYSRGVTLDLAGRDPFFIPVADLRGAGRATWTIDRVVENDGLVFVRWMLGTTAIDTYLRLSDSAASSALVSTLLDLLPVPHRAEGTTS